MRILLVDVGGSSVKLMIEDGGEVRKIPSGEDMVPTRLVKKVKKHTQDWQYDVIAMGYPGVVRDGVPALEPGNLGKGWVGFDFADAFGCKVRIMNDAALQALASYHEGRMLFLGFGTGLGSTLIVDHFIVPLELGELQYDEEHTLEDMLGKRSRAHIGQKRWQKIVERTVDRVRAAFTPDYIVLGGGEAKYIEPLPPGTQRGDNTDAYRGAVRLWSFATERTKTNESTWTIL